MTFKGDSGSGHTASDGARMLSTVELNRKIFELLTQIKQQGVNATAREKDITERTIRIEELVKAVALSGDAGKWLGDDLVPDEQSKLQKSDEFEDGPSMELEISDKGSIRKLNVTRRFWIMLVKVFGKWIWDHRTWVGFALGAVIHWLGLAFYWANFHRRGIP